MTETTITPTPVATPGATLLALVTVALRLPLPRGRALRGTLLYGALTFGAAFGLGYCALVELHAGLGQTLLAVVLLATLLLAAAQGRERLNPRAVAGALVALAGIVIMSGPAAGDAPPLSLLAAIGSALCFAEAAVLVPVVWLDDEPLSAGLVAGAGIVLAGVWAGLSAQRGRATREASRCRWLGWEGRLGGRGGAWRCSVFCRWLLLVWVRPRRRTRESTSTARSGSTST